MKSKPVSGQERFRELEVRPAYQNQGRLSWSVRICSVEYKRAVETLDAILDEIGEDEREEVLLGKRELNARQIKRLAKRFCVSPEDFDKMAAEFTATFAGKSEKEGTGAAAPEAAPPEAHFKPMQLA